MSAERRREVDRIRERLRHLNAFMVVFRDMQGSGMQLTERDWALMNQMQAEIDGLNARLRQILGYWKRRNYDRQLGAARRHLRDEDATEFPDILTLVNSMGTTLAGSTGGTLFDGILSMARDFLAPIIDAIGGWARLGELLLSPIASDPDKPALNHSTRVENTSRDPVGSDSTVSRSIASGRPLSGTDRRSIGSNARVAPPRGGKFSKSNNRTSTSTRQQNERESGKIESSVEYLGSH